MNLILVETFVEKYIYFTKKIYEWKKKKNGFIKFLINLLWQRSTTIHLQDFFSTDTGSL